MQFIDLNIIQEGTFLLDILINNEIHDLHNEYYVFSIIKQREKIIVSLFPNKFYRIKTYNPKFVLLFFNNITEDNFHNIYNTSKHIYHIEETITNFGKGKILEDGKEIDHNYFYLEIGNDGLLEVECKDAFLLC